MTQYIVNDCYKVECDFYYWRDEYAIFVVEGSLGGTGTGLNSNDIEFEGGALYAAGQFADAGGGTIVGEFLLPTSIQLVRDESSEDDN